jgi:hypothetical protein
MLATDSSDQVSLNEPQDHGQSQQKTVLPPQKKGLSLLVVPHYG